MKIVKVEPIQCDAFWGSYTFAKIETDSGLVGYGECTDWRMPRAVAAGICDLTTLINGQDPMRIDSLLTDMARLSETAPGGVIQRSISGIESALLDIKGKALGVPVYELLGGKVRDRVRVYWSHCGTYRAEYPSAFDTNPIRSYSDIEDLGKEVVARGYTALKTNLVIPGDPASVYSPSDGIVSASIIDKAVNLIGAFKEGAGQDFDVALDINFHYNTESAIRIARALEQFDMLWLEVDSFEPEVIREIKDSTTLAICSAESVTTYREYRRFLDLRAMDVAMIDLCWAGVSQGMRIAHQAASQEIPVAPHNLWSHLATFQAAHFCAALNNVQIMETDVDAAPWRDELVTELPEIVDGDLIVPDRPGWGTNLCENAIKQYPWTGAIPAEISSES